MKKYKISNIKSDIRGTEIRIISREKPLPDAARAEAGLEDVFLYYFGETGGEGRAEI